MAQKRKAQEAFGRPQGQLSAFAAAKLARQSGQPSGATSGPSSDAPPESELDTQGLAEAVANVPYDGRHSGLKTPGAPALEYDDAAIATPSRREVIQLSSFKPTIKPEKHANVFCMDNGLSEARRGARQIVLSMNETVTLIGEYSISVFNGAITFYGTVLTSKSPSYRVFAPSTHPLPQIQARQDRTQVHISPVHTGIRKLENLSPLFRNIWAAPSQVSWPGEEVPPEASTFTFLAKTSDDSLQRSLNPLEIDRETELVLRTITNKSSQGQNKNLRIMAVGAKSSGKSTFNRVLCNHLITSTPNKKCYYLDLDPGQPEFGAPGQISLVEVNTPMLGPSITHPNSRTSTDWRLVRSHTIAATSFKEDTHLYKVCAMDLVSHNDNRFPLIINSCGWITGLGANVLAELSHLLDVTDIVFLDPMDDTLVRSLRPTTRDTTLTFHKIPRRAPKPSSRTPAETRAMQTLAYFHYRGLVLDTFFNQSNPRWTEHSLSQMRPWIVSYAGGDAGVVAIVSYGQSPKPEFLAEVLDGSIIAIVVREAETLEAMNYAFNEPAGAEAEQLLYPLSDVVARTSGEDLPYLLPTPEGQSRTLNPTTSHCVGLALVRAIDTETKTLHLVTPLGEDDIADEVMDKQVFLVRGAFDPPEWAYLEGLHGNPNAMATTSNETERPWVSVRQIGGIEAAVWRLRHPPTANQVQ